MLESRMVAHQRNYQAGVCFEDEAMLRQVDEIPCSYRKSTPRMASNPKPSATYRQC